MSKGFGRPIGMQKLANIPGGGLCAVQSEGWAVRDWWEYKSSGLGEWEEGRGWKEQHVFNQCIFQNKERKRRSVTWLYCRVEITKLQPDIFGLKSRKRGGVGERK